MMRYFGKALAAALACSMLCSSAAAAAPVNEASTPGGSGSTIVEVTGDAMLFNVTVPTSVLIHVDSDGNVTVGDGGDIVNNCAGPVKVESATVTAKSGWELADYGGGDMAFGDRKFGLELNGSAADAVTGAIDVSSAGFPSIPGGSTLGLDWAADVPLQKTDVSATDIASVVFVIRADEAGPVVPPGSVYYCRLVISYVDEDGNEVAPMYTRSYEAGSSYYVESPVIDGYIPDCSVVEGRIRNSLSVIVTYAKDEEIEEPDVPLGIQDAPVMNDTFSYSYSPKQVAGVSVGKRPLRITGSVEEKSNSVNELMWVFSGSAVHNENSVVINKQGNVDIVPDFDGQIDVYCVDRLGNRSNVVHVGEDIGSLRFVIEDDAPVINTDFTDDGIAVSVCDNVNDAVSSGLAAVTYEIDGVGTYACPDSAAFTNSISIYEESFLISSDLIPTGITEITVTAMDQAGNIQSKPLIYEKQPDEAEAVPFVVTANNRSMVGYTGAADENLVIPRVFTGDDGVFYRVTEISDEAFSECSELKSVVIPDGVTSIGEAAFRLCGKLESVAIPDSVTSIGDRAFSTCSSLKSISLPEGVTSVGLSTFFDCSSLKSASMPGVINVGRQAFVRCYELASVVAPNVTSLEEKAFFSCNALPSADFPNVKSIGYDAFTYCASLSSVTISGNATKTSINKNAFQQCISLKEIVYGNATYMSVSDFLDALR